MIEVFFRGHGDWLIEGSNGEMSQVISIEKRMTRIKSNFANGWVGYRSCDEVSGIFRLTEDDEHAYRYTESLNLVKKLLPSSHPDSAFLKMAAENNLSNEDAERCHFMIVDKHRRFGKVIELPYDIKALKAEELTKAKAMAQAETILNSISIIKQRGKTRHNDALELLRTAVSEIKLNTGKNPEAEELVIYVLKEDFAHQNIQKRDPENISIKRRKLKLTDGTELDAKGIRRRYRETILKN